MVSTVFIAALVCLATTAFAQNNTAVTISGGGSSAASEYIIDFAAKATSLANQPVDITYNTTSSTSGLTALLAKTQDWSISDVPFSPALYTSNYSQIPFALGIFSVASDYNISNFIMDAATLAGIYTCTLTTWEQVSSSVGQNLGPTGKIIPVARSDGSGTTMLTTTYMASAGTAAWPYGANTSIAWPSCVQTASGSANVAALIKSVSQNAIGYLEYGIAKNTSLFSASLKNVAGNYITPATASGAAYDSLALPVPPNCTTSAWSSLILGTSTLSTAYPITSIEFFFTPTALSSIPNAAKTGTQALVKQWISYLLSEQAQTTAASTAFDSFGSLPTDILQVAVTGAAALVTTDNTAFGLPAASAASTPASG